MDTISVNGEQYVKASSIARELGYTADYVGQLCRSGKVDAQLIGRSWYVSDDSIRAHKRDRYRSTKAKSKESVREQLAAQTQSVPSLRKPSHFYKSVTTPAHHYEADSYDLLPAVPTRIDRERPEPPQEPEMEEVIQEPREDQVHEVSIRTIRKPERPERPWKPESKRKPIEREEQPVAKLITNEDTSEVVLVGEDGRGGSVVMGILSALLALVSFLALIGLESQVIANNSSSTELYRFNLASAVESLIYFD